MARVRKGGLRATKAKSVGPMIKQQLNGRRHEVVDIDTEDAMSIAGIQQDIQSRPEKYATVDLFGVPVIVRISDD